MRLRVRNVPFDLLVADLKVRPTKIQKACTGLRSKRAKLRDDVSTGTRVIAVALAVPPWKAARIGDAVIIQSSRHTNLL